MAINPNVGSRKLYEDDNVILWEFELEPGAKTPVHTHTLDYFFHVIDGTLLEVFDANDQPLGSFQAPSGETFSFRVENGDLVSNDHRNLRLNATHAARNGGTTRYREVLVEKKR